MKKYLPQHTSARLAIIKGACGGTGTDSTVPTNTVQVLITTGTVTDSGWVYTRLLGVLSVYIYRTGVL